MRPTIASTSTLDPQTKKEPNGKVYNKVNHMTSLLSTTKSSFIKTSPISTYINMSSHSPWTVQTVSSFTTMPMIMPTTSDPSVNGVSIVVSKPTITYIRTSTIEYMYITDSFPTSSEDTYTTSHIKLPVSSTIVYDYVNSSTVSLNINLASSAFISSIIKVNTSSHLEIPKNDHVKWLLDVLIPVSSIVLFLIIVCVTYKFCRKRKLIRKKEDFRHISLDDTLPSNENGYEDECDEF